MEFKILIFTVLMGLTVLISNFQKKESTLSKRKNQSKNMFRENLVKQKIEKLTEEKVKFSKRHKIELNCAQAGFKISYAEYLLFSIGFGIVFSIIMGVALNNLALSILFLFIGYLTPGQAIHFIKNARVRKIEDQIGSFMQMVTKRYEAMKDFGYALELTMEEFKGIEPIYSEIQKTHIDIKIGVPIEDALGNMGRRTGNRYMARYSAFYQISSHLGTDKIKHRMLGLAIKQYKSNREVKRLLKKDISGPVREAYIMLVSVPAFAMYQVATNPTYLDFMTKTTVGKGGTAGIFGVLIFAVWFINAKIAAPIEE